MLGAKARLVNQSRFLFLGLFVLFLLLLKLDLSLWSLLLFKLERLNRSRAGYALHLFRE